MSKSKAQRLAKKANRVRKREIALDKREKRTANAALPTDYLIRIPLAEKAAPFMKMWSRSMMSTPQTWTWRLTVPSTSNVQVPRS
jgi:hypothetical protein